MPYISRDESGAITALFQEASKDAAEFVPATDPEIHAFLGLPASQNFAGLDAGFIRVVEDLIDILLAKGLLLLTDLPPHAQQKLLARKDMRRKMQGALDLLNDNDVI